MKDITRHCYAEGQSNVPRGSENTAHLVAHQQAFEEAYIAFVGKHGRSPNWDMVNFRGGHSTTGVVLEIWEEDK